MSDDFIDFSNIFTRFSMQWAALVQHHDVTFACSTLCIVCVDQVICGQNCTFVIQANGTVMACGEGSYGRLGQGNSDDLHSLTVISALQGVLDGCHQSSIVLVF